jgi:hypothetical protein
MADKNPIPRTQRELNALGENLADRLGVESIRAFLVSGGSMIHGPADTNILISLISALCDRVEELEKKVAEGS